MVNKYIVECPHCKMRFFVTGDLLVTANGALRCGFCLHVFQGKENIVYEAMGNTISENSLEPSSSVDNGHVVAINQTEGTDQASYSEDYWREVVTKFSSFSIHPSNIDQALDTIEKQEPIEPSIIMSNQPIQTTIDVSVEPSSIDIDTDITDYLNSVDFDLSLQKDEEQLVTDHNKEVDRYLSGVVIEKPVITDVDAVNLAQTELAFTTERAQQPLYGDNKADNTVPILDNDSVVRDIYGNKLKVISDVDFESYTQPPKLVNKSNLLWGILCVAAILLLIAQYLHFAVPKMAQNIVDRPWAEKVCSYVFCKLPIQIDVDKIKTDKLVVRNDPNHAGALLVDSIIYNMASFSQPYPLIELRFNNVNGQVVASRRFSPKEYLNDEVLRENQMPANMPVYISLQVIDPGEEATGYSLHYYPAPQASTNYYH